MFIVLHILLLSLDLSGSAFCRWEEEEEKLALGGRFIQSRSDKWVGRWARPRAARRTRYR